MSGSSSVALAAIVTPIWRPRLTENESWNVRRSISGNGALDHVFVAPRSLDVQYYREQFPESRIRRVDDRALTSTASYSRLMLSSRFYGSFAEFEFIVICQSDAFLTRDIAPLLRGEEHDYIGAPWRPGHTTTPVGNYFPRTLGRLDAAVRGLRILPVGNGGLSVRRVSAHRAALRSKPLLARFSRINEDVVLSYLGTTGDLRVASEEYASGVFFERGTRVPREDEVFGFHAFERYYPDEYEEMQRRWS